MASGAREITPRVAVEDRVIKARVPPGSRFKGYEIYVVHDVVLHAEVVRYRRERWITPDGTTVLAALPGVGISDRNCVVSC